jgi:hypothetical protein
MLHTNTMTFLTDAPYPCCALMLKASSRASRLLRGGILSRFQFINHSFNAFDHTFRL